MKKNREKIIFFGNGPLADYVLEVLEQKFEIVFHAREKADLEEACRLKKEDPSIHGVLASLQRQRILSHRLKSHFRSVKRLYKVAKGKDEHSKFLPAQISLKHRI